MSKRMISLLLVLVLLLSMLPLTALATESTSTATAARNVEGFLAPVDDPDASAVKITTAEELSAIRNDLYGNYVLMNDIDLSGYGSWSPIGATVAGAFKGKLDGQGYKITGLKVNVSFNSGTIIAPNYAVGLFGVLDGAQVKNLFLENVNVSVTTTSGYGYEYTAIDSGYSVFAGPVAGVAINSTIIQNCHTSGTVLAKAYEEGYSDAFAGGLVGFANTVGFGYNYVQSSVSAYNGNAVSAYQAYAGGLAGAVVGEGEIKYCFNAGAVTATTQDYGNACAGGLVAHAQNADLRINDSFNEGAVQATAGNWFCDQAYAGGIAALFNGFVLRTYNSGGVVANAKDPYGIAGSVAYAGGICATGNEAATITQCAVVHTTVSATGSTKYQYRISQKGTKTNNVSVSTMTSGSTSDANTLISASQAKTQEMYTDTLGWDFTTVWEMVEGKDYPQLMQVKASGEVYNQEYIDQHLNFIAGDAYADFQANQRWAKTYWSAENNWKTNAGEMLYDGIDAAINLATLNFGELFEDNDPFKVIVADYISDQGVVSEVVELYKVKIPFELDKKYKKLKKFIEENWDEDAYGKLTDEDLFYLFHYHEQSAEDWVNQGFPKGLSEIVAADKKDQLAEIMGITTDVLDEVLASKEYLDNGISCINRMLQFSAEVSAYLSADADFKAVLTEMTSNLASDSEATSRYHDQLGSALRSYVHYNYEDNVVADLTDKFLRDVTLRSIDKYVAEIAKKGVNKWLEATLSAAALEKYNAVVAAAKGTWKVLEYVTKNGELMECRELLRANAYFEDTMYKTLKDIENRFVSSPSFEDACLFDAAFKLFKECQIASMDIVIQFLDTYQSSWAGAIKNGSKTFMNSAIEEVHINKLTIYKTYCHGTEYYLGGKVITVACPTNVYVYDEQGVLVASVEDNATTYCAGGILVYTSDTVKLFAVPLGQEYSIRIDATDNGTMDYIVSEYNGTCENVQKTVYSDVEITKDAYYTGAVSNEISSSESSYHLTSDQNVVIDNCQVTTSESPVAVESITIGECPRFLHLGDSLKLTATVAPENATVKTIAWMSSDSTVVSVDEYGNLQALSGGTATITAQSISGGAMAQVSLVVLKEGQNLYITRQPLNGFYLCGDAADALELEYYNASSLDAQINWYCAQAEDLSDGAPIDGAQGQSFIPPTDEQGIRYYYAVITAGEEQLQSDAARIEVVGRVIIETGTTEEGLIWELDSKGLLTITGTGAVPSYEAGTAPWSSFAQKIISLSLSEGITEVGSNSFTDLTALTKAELPASVETIAEGIFSGCTALEELTIPFIGENREAAGEKGILGFLFGKASEGGVVQYYETDGSQLSGYRYAIPESLKKLTVTDAASLSFGALCGCSGLSQVTINEGIVSVAGYSLYGCSGLEELVIPDSVTQIDEYALKDCSSLVKLTVPFVGTTEASENSWDAVFGAIFGRVSEGTVQYYALSGSSLSGYSYGIPATLRELTVTRDQNIALGAFSNCSSLTTVTLPENLETIGIYGFYQCTGLVDITFAGTAPSISGDAFMGVTSNAHYPEDEGSWTDEVRQDYSGEITWIGYSTASKIPTLTLKYPTLTFEDVITMNVFFQAENLEDVVQMGLITYKSEVAEWNVENAEAVVPGYELDPSGFYVASTEGIAAKDMGDTYWFAVYAKLSDGSYTYTRLVSYSPTTYAYNQLGDPAMSKLVVAMLNYGAAAQVYFGYNTDNLMNAGLTEEQNASIESYRADMMDPISTVTDEKAANFVRTATGFTKRYPTITFEGAFSIDYLCQPSATPVGDITLYYWDQTAFDAADVLTTDNATGTLTLEVSGDLYATSVEGIAAKDLDKGVYVAFVYSDGTNTYCSGILGYSIGVYCQGLASGTDTMAPFAAATAVYGYYAKQTFN